MKFLKKIISLLFVLALFAPMFGIKEVVNRDVSDEDTVLMPEFSFSFGYVFALADYFNKNFGFRDEMIYLNAWRDVKLFDSSPNLDVVVGKDGWLFLSKALVPKKLSNEDLDLVAKKLLDMQNVFEWRGTKFLFVLVPDKKSVYPEFLPDRLSSLVDANYSKFVESLSNAGVSFVALRNFLVANKFTTLYSLFDTHWNRYGAFISFVQIMKTIGFGSPVIASVDEYSRAGDLSRVVGLDEIEETLTVSLDVDDSYKSKSRLVFYYDSFGLGILPYLEMTFSGVDSTHIMSENSIDNLYSNSWGADCVIVEIVERDIPALVDILKIYD